MFKSGVGYVQEATVMRMFLFGLIVRKTGGLFSVGLDVVGLSSITEILARQGVN